MEEKELDTSKVNNAMAQIKASQTAAQAARRCDPELFAPSLTIPVNEICASLQCMSNISNKDGFLLAETRTWLLSR